MLLGYALGYLDAVVLGHLVAVLLGHLLGELGDGKEGKTHVSKEQETKLDFPGFPSLSTLFNFNYSAAAERERGRNVCCIITRPSKGLLCGGKKPLLDLEKLFLKNLFVRKSALFATAVSSAFFGGTGVV